MAALERGIHVHCNKTFCTTLKEANNLIETAERQDAKLVASPGQMIRPGHQRIRSLVHEGAIGIPTWAVGSMAFGSAHLIDEPGSPRGDLHSGNDPLTTIDPTWYIRKPGGGPLYDMVVYRLHSLTGILGPVKRVTAMSGVRIPKREFRGEIVETEMDDNSFLLLDFGDAFTGFVHGAAHGNFPGVRKFLISGTDGQINGTELNGEPIEHADVNLPHVTGSHTDIGEPHVFEDIMQLVDLIREGTPTLATPEHARHVVEIIDKAYQSAEDGQTRDLETSFELNENLMPYL